MEKINERDIQNWFIDEGIFKEKINDENAEFHYTIEYPTGNIMDVVQPKRKFDFLIVVCGTQVSPEHNALMKDATIPNREKFIYELRFMLNQLQTDFQIDVDQEYILSQFVIQDGIYADGLSKNNLMNIIKKIFRAKMTCVWLMEEKFGSIEIGDSVDVHSNDNVMFM